jgi:sugar/nucleoside kinase (ribokinase family)
MTRIDLQLRPAPRGTSALGSGFIALDVVDGGHGQFAAAGGSCGNVLTMLAWLGWSSAPVARLGADPAGEFVREDLQAFGVDLRHMTTAASVQTPIVLQRFVEDRQGHRQHRFSLVCPGCGAWLPRFRSIVLTQANEVMAEPAPKSFYFDRVSPALLRLAEWVRREGGLVFFEPSSIGDEALFRRAIDTCHVLKYSDERLGSIEDLADARQPALIVRTRGADGLDSRWQGRWSQQAAFKAPQMIDAAGSGDWCSAGLIHVMGQAGASALSTLGIVDIERGLRLGQALAALNCAYEGARGLMYAAPSLDSANLLLRDMNGDQGVNSQTLEPEMRRAQPDLCQLCSRKGVKAKVTKPKRAAKTAA